MASLDMKNHKEMVEGKWGWCIDCYNGKISIVSTEFNKGAWWKSWCRRILLNRELSEKMFPLGVTICDQPQTKDEIKAVATDIYNKLVNVFETWEKEKPKEETPAQLEPPDEDIPF